MSNEQFNFASEVESQEDADGVVRLTSVDFRQALERAYAAGASTLVEPLRGAVRRLERWPGSENPETFPEVKAARLALEKVKA